MVVFQFASRLALCCSLSYCIWSRKFSPAVSVLTGSAHTDCPSTGDDLKSRAPFGCGHIHILLIHDSFTILLQHQGCRAAALTAPTLMDYLVFWPCRLQESPSIQWRERWWDPRLIDPVKLLSCVQRRSGCCAECCSWPCSWRHTVKKIIWWQIKIFHFNKGSMWTHYNKICRCLM